MLYGSSDRDTYMPPDKEFKDSDVMEDELDMAKLRRGQSLGARICFGV
jgi:hypothetical protein